jgi:hypothetical protein
LLLDRGKKDIKAAEDMFDKKTAEGLREVVQLEAEGRHEEAHARMEEVVKSAPGGGFCGAGSCGLRFANISDSKASRMRELLKADPEDLILVDDERVCISCGDKSIWYNVTKNNKACSNPKCGATEIKG